MLIIWFLAKHMQDKRTNKLKFTSFEKNTFFKDYL